MFLTALLQILFMRSVRSPFLSAWWPKERALAHGLCFCELVSRSIGLQRGVGFRASCVWSSEKVLMTSLSSLLCGKMRSSSLSGRLIAERCVSGPLQLERHRRVHVRPLHASIARTRTRTYIISSHQSCVWDLFLCILHSHAACERRSEWRAHSQ